MLIGSNRTEVLGNKIPMRVVLSAYACEPHKGSEPEVGWRWALEIAKHHSVVVLTRANNKPVIDTYFDKHPDARVNIQFEYFDLDPWLLAIKKKLRAHECYYVIWQWYARKKINAIVKKDRIDVVHLITFASFRYPVFLGRMNVPVVWGPVGGGEIADWKLLIYRFRWPSTFREIFRNLSTYVSAACINFIDPTRSTGGVAIASTPSTQRILIKKGINCEVMPTIGIDTDDLSQFDQIPPTISGIKFLYVGRFVLLKGVHLLLEAFAQADIPNATMTLIGSGKEKRWLEKLALRFGVTDRINFVGQVQKDELPKHYRSHHVVVAPSLYESGGYTVLEAFTQKRPAIVLNVGGPALSVDENCGIKVKVGSGTEVIAGIAKAMKSYARNPDNIKQHGEAGYRKVKETYAWSIKGKKMSSIYADLVKP